MEAFWSFKQSFLADYEPADEEIRRVQKGEVVEGAWIKSLMRVSKDSPIVGIYIELKVSGEAYKCYTREV